MIDDFSTKVTGAGLTYSGSTTIYDSASSQVLYLGPLPGNAQWNDVGGGILGGTREVTMENYLGSGSVVAQATGTGNFAFSNPVLGQMDLQLDYAFNSDFDTEGIQFLDFVLGGDPTSSQNTQVGLMLASGTDGNGDRVEATQTYATGTLAQGVNVFDLTELSNWNNLVLADITEFSLVLDTTVFGEDIVLSDLQFNNQDASVPEPSTLLIASCFLGVGAGRRYRKRRKKLPSA